MGNSSKLLFWYSTFLLFFLLSAFFLIGKPTILEHLSTARPYAAVFRTATTMRPASGESEKLMIFMGDSSVARPPWIKGNAARIPTLLEAELRETCPELESVSVREWAFAGARPFHYYCLLFEAEKYSPSLIIVPINWRLLGPRSAEWNERFSFRELSALVPLRERASDSGKRILDLESISPSRQLIYISQRPMLYIIGLKMWVRAKMGLDAKEAPLNRLDSLPPAEFLLARHSDQELFTDYAKEVPSDNAQLRVLRSIAETSARHNLELLCYITPIHLEEMQRRPSFDHVAFRQSVERVAESVSSETSTCLNLAGLLPEEDFIDDFEHYTIEGNRKIARALAPAIREFLASSHPLLEAATHSLNIADSQS